MAGVSFPAVRGWPLCSTVTGRGGRSPYVTAHRRGTGLGWGGEAVRAPATGWGLAPGGRRGGKGPVGDGPAAGQAALGCGGLLRQLRVDAGLTQDELAEAAQVSQRAISDLERGINATARKDTAVLLAGALGLDGPVCELFIAAACGRAPASEALAAAAPGAGGPAAARRALPPGIGGLARPPGRPGPPTAPAGGDAP